MQSSVTFVFALKHDSKKKDNQMLSYLAQNSVRATQYLSLGVSLMHLWSASRLAKFRCSSLDSLHVWHLRDTLLVSRILFIYSSIDTGLAQLCSKGNCGVTHSNDWVHVPSLKSSLRNEMRGSKRGAREVNKGEYDWNASCT